MNYSTLIKILLPYSLRYSKWINAHLMAGVNPIRQLYSNVKLWYKSWNFFVSITPQTCRLRYGINELLDSDLRRITIEDGVDVTPLQLWIDDEDKFVNIPRYDTIFQIVINIHRDDIISNGYGFVIGVPIELMGEKNRIIAFIDRYKLVSVSYLIKIHTA